MFRSLLIGICLLASYALSSQDWSRSDIDIYYSFDDFEKVLTKDNDTTYLVNFWATWCVPCVKELPYFEAINEKYKDSKLEVVLVSLDFAKHIDSRLVPFLNKKKIGSEVKLLLDENETKWIDRVDPKWSGSIPITIVYKGENRDFYEKAFHSTKELEGIINEYINTN